MTADPGQRLKLRLTYEEFNVISDAVTSYTRKHLDDDDIVERGLHLTGMLVEECERQGVPSWVWDVDTTYAELAGELEVSLDGAQFEIFAEALDEARYEHAQLIVALRLIKRMMDQTVVQGLVMPREG